MNAMVPGQKVCRTSDSLSKRAHFQLVRIYMRQSCFEHPDVERILCWLQVCAIFGFCDIRQFTDATEVLQEEVMEFVNSIAKIVHMETSLHGGFPNKNIGDAFLLVRIQPPSLIRHLIQVISLVIRLMSCLHGSRGSLKVMGGTSAITRLRTHRHGSFPRASTCATSSH